MAATYRSAAAILRRRVTSGARPGAGPPLAALPRRVESARDVGDEVGGVLDAGAEADVALAHPLGPPARPALRARVQSAEARRLGHERQRREERLRALGALQREADDRADAGPAEVGDGGAGTRAGGGGAGGGGARGAPAPAGVLGPGPGRRPAGAARGGGGSHASNGP